MFIYCIHRYYYCCLHVIRYVTNLLEKPKIEFCCISVCTNLIFILIHIIYWYHNLCRAQKGNYRGIFPLIPHWCNVIFGNVLLTLSKRYNVFTIVKVIINFVFIRCLTVVSIHLHGTRKFLDFLSVLIMHRTTEFYNLIVALDFHWIISWQHC